MALGSAFQIPENTVLTDVYTYIYTHTHIPDGHFHHREIEKGDLGFLSLSLSLSLSLRITNCFLVFCSKILRSKTFDLGFATLLLGFSSLSPCRSKLFEGWSKTDQTNQQILTQATG